MSISITTAARPYAKAIFTLALAEHTLVAWAGLLQAASRIVQDQALRPFLQHPRFRRAGFDVCLANLCQAGLFEQGKSLLKLLAERQRLLWLPKITKLFSAYRAQHERRIQVQVVSTIALQKEEQQSLERLLGRRLHTQIECDYQVDSRLLGGLMIRAGDLVIDSTLRHKLDRLRNTLMK